MATQYTTADVALKLDTNTRTLRKFLRADAAAKGATTPGKGSRYMIEGRELQGLKKRFKAWSAEIEAAKAAKVEAPAEVEVEDDDPQLTEQGKRDKDFEETTDC